MNLQQLVDSLEYAQVELKVVEGLQQGATMLKVLNSQLQKGLVQLDD